MNRKQFVILLVVVAVLGAAGWKLQRNHRDSWQAGGRDAGRKLLGDLAINDVAQITIKSDTNSLTLAKKDGLWRVVERGDFPADYTEISGFLIKAVDLVAVQMDEVGPSQLGRYQLLPPGPGTNTATLVELKDQAGKTLQTLLLGKMLMPKALPEGGRPSRGSPDGRYLMVGAGAKQVALVSDPLEQIAPQAASWLNKTFIKVEKIRTIVVTHPEATNNWSLSRTNETAPDWVLADAMPEEEIDKNKMSGLGSFLAFAAFDDVETRRNDAELGLDKPVKIAIETFGDFKYDLTVGHLAGSQDAWLRFTVGADLKKERAVGADEKPEDKAKLDKEFADNLNKQADKLQAEQALAKWTYKVSESTLATGLKNRSELFAEKKAEGDATNAIPGTAMPPIDIPSLLGPPGN